MLRGDLSSAALFSSDIAASASDSVGGMKSLGGFLGSDRQVMKRRTSDVRLDGTLTEI